MANKTKFQKLLSEFIDTCIEDYTDKDISLDVKEEIKEMQGINNITFDTGYNTEVTLSDIIEDIVSDYSEVKANVVEKLLTEKSIEWKLRYLSGDFQFELTLENQNVVINEGTEKDFVVFIGDIAIDLTEKELDSFLEENKKFPKIKDMLGDKDYQSEQLDKLKNHFSGIGYDMSEDEELLKKVETDVRESGYATFNKTKVSFDIPFFSSESVITIFTLNNTKYISINGYEEVEELKYNNSIEELEEKIVSKYEAIENMEETKAWHTNTSTDEDSEGENIGIEVAPLMKKEDLKNVGNHQTMDLGDYQLVVQIKKDLYLSGLNFTVKEVDRIVIPFTLNSVVITVKGGSAYISSVGNLRKEKLKYSSIAELKQIILTKVNEYIH